MENVNISQNAGEEVNNNALISEEIATLTNCPFSAVLSGGRYYLTFGEKILSNETFSSVKEAQKYVDRKPWDLIIVAAAVLANDLITYNNKIKNV